MDFGQLMADAVAKQATTNPADAVAGSLAMQKSVVASLGYQNQAADNLTNVQVQAADKADTLRTEAAALTSKNAVDVVSMWQQTATATQAGVEAAKNHLAQAVAKTQQAAELDASRPSVFTNPLAAITSAYKSSELEAQARSHEKTASTLATDVNSLLQMSRVQIADTIAANGLLTSAKLAERSAELSKGIAQAQIVADADVARAGRFDAASKELWEVQKNSVTWLQNRQQLAMQKAGNDLQARKLALEEATLALDTKDRQMLEANVDNVATAIATSRAKGKAITEADKITARSAASALLKADPLAFSQVSQMGHLFKTSGTLEQGWAASMKDATIGALQIFGAYAGNPDMQNFGSELLNVQYAKNLDSLYKQQYAEYKASNGTKSYDMWIKDGISKSAQKQLETLALDTARTNVASMRVGDYAATKTGQRQFSSAGINLTNLGEANLVKQTYGYAIGSKENAVLSSPQLKAAMQQAQQAGGSKDGTVRGMEVLVDFLSKGGVADPYKVAAKVYAGQQAGAMLQEDKEYRLVTHGGYQAPVKAIMVQNGEQFDIANSEGVKRAILRYKNPPVAFTEKVSNTLGDAMMFAAKDATPSYWAQQVATQLDPDAISAALQAGLEEKSAARRAAFTARMDYVTKNTPRNPMPTNPPLQPELGTDILSGMDFTISPTGETPQAGARSPRDVQPRDTTFTERQPRGTAPIASDSSMEFLDNNANQLWWQK